MTYRIKWMKITVFYTHIHKNSLRKELTMKINAKQIAHLDKTSRYLPDSGVEVSAVASKNDELKDLRPISDDFLLNSGASSSPSEASTARFSRSLFRLWDLDPESVLGVFFPPAWLPGVPSFSSKLYIISSAQPSICMLAHNHWHNKWMCILLSDEFLTKNTSFR